MKISFYDTPNYAVYEARGGGVIMLNLIDNSSTFFQAGDDSQEIRNCVQALDENLKSDRDMLFDMICSQYT